MRRKIAHASGQLTSFYQLSYFNNKNNDATEISGDILSQAIGLKSPKYLFIQQSLDIVVHIEFTTFICLYPHSLNPRSRDRQFCCLHPLRSELGN